MLIAMKETKTIKLLQILWNTEMYSGGGEREWGQGFLHRNVREATVSSGKLKGTSHGMTSPPPPLHPQQVEQQEKKQMR